MSVQLPYPLDERGFIDEKKVFQIVVGTLKLPISILDEITPVEIGWLLETYVDEKMEHYELIASAVSFGNVSSQKGKKIPMFKKKDEDKVGKISKEKKEEDLKYIENIFAKEGESN